MFTAYDGHCTILRFQQKVLVSCSMLIRFDCHSLEFCFQLHADDWFTIALDRNSITSVNILNGGEEIFAHFSKLTIDKAIEITERDYWTVIDVQVTETVDKTTDSLCNGNEEYRRTGKPHCHSINQQ